MPLPQAVARFNRRCTNRFIEPLVARLPGFVIVAHAGRKTGTTYRTPLYAFESNDTLFMALTYGPSADWAQNVLAGGGSVERQAGTFSIASAAVVDRSEAWSQVPLLARAGLRALRVTDFMQITLR